MAEEKKADLDAILDRAEVESRQEAARRDWTVVRERLFIMSEEVVGFFAEMMARKLGRQPSPEEVAEKWGGAIRWFGQILAQYGAAGWADDLPGSTPEEVCARELLRLSCQPDGQQDLLCQVARLHCLEHSHRAFYSQVRTRLREYVDLLLNRARETFSPSSAGHPGQPAKEADPAPVPSTLGDGREEREGAPPPTDQECDPPRELVRDYLLGRVELSPEQQRQYLGLDPDEAVEVLHPEQEELRRWAGIAEVRGKFLPGWWELPAACRFWRIPTDGEPNHWLPLIADCMRELFGSLMHEEDLLGYLSRRHRMLPSPAASLSLADLADLLRDDCDRRTTCYGDEPAPTAPGENPPSGVEDRPAYKVEDQPWYTPLPATRDVRSEELTALADDIDLVLITATDPELGAVLRLLEPYPRRRSVLKGFVEQETYFLGKFGDCRTAVTQCRMGSLDPGSATLTTGHAQRVWHPRAVAMVGIAFGKDPAKQKIADVLVASQVISYEPQRVGVQETAQRGPITPSDTTLLNRFVTVPHWSFCRPDGSRCERHVGAVVSGEKLVDEEVFKADLFGRYPQAIGGEMEGVGLAAAAVRHRVPWILVKAVCDWADGKKHKKHQPLAAAAAVSLVHHVLSQADVLHGLAKPSQP